MARYLIGFVFCFSMVSPALAGLSTDTPDLRVTVTNFDGQFVFFKDKKGNEYKMPRGNLSNKSFKIHESFMVHSAGLKKFKVKKKKKPKVKPKTS